MIAVLVVVPVCLFITMSLKFMMIFFKLSFLVHPPWRLFFESTMSPPEKLNSRKVDSSIIVRRPRKQEVKVKWNGLFHLKLFQFINFQKKIHWGDLGAKVCDWGRPINGKETLSKVDNLERNHSAERHFHEKVYDRWGILWNIYFVFWRFQSVEK